MIQTDVFLARPKWDVWSGVREKVRAPSSKPIFITEKELPNSGILTLLNAMATLRESWRYVKCLGHVKWWYALECVFTWTDVCLDCLLCRTSSTTPAVELPWPRWRSVTHTGSRRGLNCSSQLRESTLASSSTVARRVRAKARLDSCRFCHGAQY